MKTILIFLAALAVAVTCLAQGGAGGHVVQTTPYTRGLLRASDAATARVTLGTTNIDISTGASNAMVSAWAAADNRRIYHVADFGAVPDDATDDTAAIQAAIASAKSGVLQFDAGEYNITNTLVLTTTNGGMIFRGKGGLNIGATATDFMTVLKFGHTNGPGVLIKNFVHGTQMRNLFVQGVGPTNTTWAAIQVGEDGSDVNNFRTLFEGCTMVGWPVGMSRSNSIGQIVNMCDFRAITNVLVYNNGNCKDGSSWFVNNSYGQMPPYTLTNTIGIYTVPGNSWVYLSIQGGEAGHLHRFVEAYHNALIDVQHMNYETPLGDSVFYVDYPAQVALRNIRAGLFGGTATATLVSVSNATVTLESCSWDGTYMVTKRVDGGNVFGGPGLNLYAITNMGNGHVTRMQGPILEASSFWGDTWRMQVANSARTNNFMVRADMTLMDGPIQVRGWQGVQDNMLNKFWSGNNSYYSVLDLGRLGRDFVLGPVQTGAFFSDTLSGDVVYSLYNLDKRHRMGFNTVGTVFSVGTNNIVAKVPIQHTVTNVAPADTVTPDVWVDFQVGGSTYRFPGYTP